MYITDDKIFQESGITGTCEIGYSRNNIILGENGAGKSRFLRSIRKYYVECLNYKAEDIIYAYIPNISPENKKEEKKLEVESPLVDLIINKDKVSFDDFVVYLEEEGEDFIGEIFSMAQSRYRSRTDTGKKLISKLNEFLKEFIHREIIYRNGVINIIKEDSKEDITLKQLFIFMSPGERLLFYLSIYLLFVTYKYKNSDDLVIILDEPELHLHTKALSKFITLLKSDVHYSSLWIATHAFSIIPEFEFNEIIYINNGSIQKRDSQLYRNIYTSLIGSNDIKLYDFLVSIDYWEYYNFIAECFCPPKVKASAKIDDPQFIQFYQAISYSEKDKPYKVLDYGGGEGRIGKCIELFKKNGGRDCNNVEYHIFEPDLKYKTEGFKRFNTIKEIRAERQKYDCIVLMNVLHEIDVKEWRQTFEIIGSLLKADGYLIFIEARSLTSGEQPYCKNGYLVLYLEQLKILFDTKDIISIGINSKSNCFIINANYFIRVSEKTIKKALISLQNQTHKELNKSYRDKINNRDKSDDLSIRKYAYLSQLYINSLFAADRISDKGNTILDDENEVEINWKKILEIEKTTNDKDKIIRLLTINAGYGHEKSINRLKNNYRIIL